MRASNGRHGAKSELLIDRDTARRLGPPAAAGPIIEITPTEHQYRQLMRDLKILRAAGAYSNTAAILEAVHRLAATATHGYDAAFRDEAAGRR